MGLIMPDSLNFILGRGRSGSTLLSKMLNMNSSVSVAPEGLFIRNTIGKYGTIGNWDAHVIESFVTDIFREKRMEWWPIGKEDLMAFFQRNGPPDHFLEACMGIYRCYAHHMGKGDGSILLDKNPHYALYSARLRKIFPNAKFLHLVRDYRDNVQSYKQVRFDLNDTAALAYRWRKFNQVILDNLMDYNDYKCVRFEDLVTEPDSTLKEICAFLHCDYNTAMLDYYKNEEKEERGWHHHTKHGVDPKLAYKWKSQDIKDVILISERICDHVGEKFGYKPSMNKNIGNQFEIYKGLILGWIVTKVESRIFLLPLKWRLRVINFYRRMAGAK